MINYNFSMASRPARKPRRPGRPRAAAADLRERVLDAAVTRFAAAGIAATPKPSGLCRFLP